MATKQLADTARQPQRGIRLADDDIENALYKARGNISRAAEYLGCTRGTIANRVKASPELSQTVEDLRERFLDDAEATFEKKCLEGDTTSLIFLLKTRGAPRGYAQDESGNSAKIIARQAFDFIFNQSRNPAAASALPPPPDPA